MKTKTFPLHHSSVIILVAYTISMACALAYGDHIISSVKAAKQAIVVTAQSALESIK